MEALLKPRERPILFSAPMIRALLAGTKTQTRWIVKPQPALESQGLVSHPTLCGHFAEHVFGACMAKLAACPYGAPGDRLWVRESHAQFAVGNSSGTSPQCVAYRATCDEDGGFTYVNDVDSEIMRLKITKWTPSIHMPRWASRITLDITGVRVERLHDITEDDAKAEGVSCYESQDGIEQSATEVYADLWRSINGADSWDADPWVWVVGFKRVEVTP